MTTPKKSVKPVEVVAVAIAAIVSLVMVASVYEAMTAPSREMQKLNDEVDASIERVREIQQEKAQQQQNQN